jgi:hypothetical protein
MGLFSLFQKRAEPLDNYFHLLQSQILEISEFRNFNNPNEDYLNELIEFKKFIVIFVSACLYIYKVKQHLNIDSFKVSDPIYQKIFQTLYRQVLPFYKSYVQNDKIIIGLFNNNLLEEDKMLTIDILARFGKYEEEIKEGYKTGNPFFFEEYESEDEDDDSNNQMLGGNIYFEYIRLLLLTKIEKNKDNKLKVNEIEILELDDDQIDKLSSFVKSISSIILNIKITSEMLS